MKYENQAPIPGDKSVVGTSLISEINHLPGKASIPPSLSDKPKPLSKESPADAFKKAFSSEEYPENKIQLLLDFIDYYNYSHFEQISGIMDEALISFTESGFFAGQALIRVMFAYVSFEKGNSDDVHKELTIVQAIFDQISMPEVKAQILNFQAFLHSHQGDFEKAFEFCYASMNESEMASNKKLKYWGNYTLGVFYYDLKDFANAEKAFRQGLQGFLKHQNLYGAARCETGLSSLYIETHKYDEAEKLVKHSLAYYSKVEENPGKARSLNDLGVIFRKKGQLSEALAYFEQSLALRRKINHSQGIATSLNEISEVLIGLKEFSNAEKCLMESLEICEKIRNRSKLYRAHFLFSQLYRQTDQPWKALEHYDLFEQIKSDVVGETANNKIQELQSRMQTERSEKEKEIERLKNVELKKAYAVIEDKNKSITDSINYALKIQTSILPPIQTVHHYFPDSFIFYKPKDIVSGDFYWMETVGTKLLFATCDCTGHGVPGALVSVICHNALNRAIREFGITQPAAILDQVAIIVRENFRNSDDDIQDGMDISLCSLDMTTMELEWSGAKNPLWLIQNEELSETRADNQSIGLTPEMHPFTNHTFRLKTGDCIYLFTDGYSDQFGGENGQRKISKKGMKEKLLSVLSEPMLMQCQFLETFLQEFRMGQDQIDDILVMGLRIP